MNSELKKNTILKISWVSKDWGQAWHFWYTNKVQHCSNNNLQKDLKIRQWANTEYYFVKIWHSEEVFNVARVLLWMFEISETT